MNEVRVLFGTTLVEIAVFLGEQRARLAGRFEGPSALAEFTVRGLAGHLRRAMTSLESYLDQPAPGAGAAVISPAQYYATVLPDDVDLGSDLHRTIRQRGLEAASGSPDDLATQWADTAAGLIARLEQEAEDRLVQVLGDLVLTLDDYLVTRLIELVVHTDDLAVSLEVPAPSLPAGATGLAIDTLVEVARLRHGDTAVLRALARRERDSVGALRVL